MKEKTREILFAVGVLLLVGAFGGADTGRLSLLPMAFISLAGIVCMVASLMGGE